MQAKDIDIILAESDEGQRRLQMQKTNLDEFAAAEGQKILDGDPKCGWEEQK